MRYGFFLAAFLWLSPLVAQDIPLFTSDFPPEEFAQRRSAVFEAIGKNAMALVQGAPSPVAYVRFRQSNEFYYLCGVESPHAYLLLDGSQLRTSLYLPHRHQAREAGEGKVLSAEDGDLIRQLTGIDNVYGIDQLAEHLGRFVLRGEVKTIHTVLTPAEGLATSRDGALRTVADHASDPWDGRPSREGQFVSHLRLRFPAFEIRDLSPILDNLRLIKSDCEIDLIRKATRLSGLALMEAARSTVPGIKEYELDAIAKYIFHRHLAQGDAYYSLIASSTNAWYPHYNAGKRVVQEGDFLLMDYAPDVGYYMSDVTRMWPVNGRFNTWQRELYGFYLACYKAILNSIRPGVTAQAIKQKALEEMKTALASSRFSKAEYQRAAEEFVKSYGESATDPETRLGHWVGMATHDVGHASGPLRAGMVFTIEPALRVPEEKVYIRLEDVILITNDGAEILSDFVPMEMDEIEKLMQEEGMLQRYPWDHQVHRLP